MEGGIGCVDEGFHSPHSRDSRLKTGNRESGESDESLGPLIADSATALNNRPSLFPSLPFLPWFSADVRDLRKKQNFEAVVVRMEGGIGCVDEGFHSPHSRDSRLKTGNRESGESDESLGPLIAGWATRPVP